MQEIIYGLINNANVVTETVVVKEGDATTLSRVILEHGAVSAFPINIEKETIYIGVSYWSGTRFLNPSPYPSWVWDDGLNTWVAPISYPTNNKNYVWDENTISWKEVV